MNPLLLASLLQQQQGGQQQGMGGGGMPSFAPQFPSPPQGGMAGSAGAGMMRPPMMPGSAGPQPGQSPGGMAGGMQNPMQLMQLLQLLKGQQGGAPGQNAGQNATMGGLGSPITMPSQMRPGIPPVGGSGEYSAPIGPMQPTGILSWLQGLMGSGGGASG